MKLRIFSSLAFHRSLSVLVMAASGPLWVLGLVLTPIAELRALCYRACTAASSNFVMWNRPQDMSELESFRPAILDKWKRRARGRKHGRPRGLR